MSRSAGYSYSGLAMTAKDPVIVRVCSYSLKPDDTNYQDLFLKNWLVLVPLVPFLQQITLIVIYIVTKLGKEIKILR